MNYLRACIALILAIAFLPARATNVFPDHQIRLIVGFVPGGGEDAIARIVGYEISKELGQPVIIENRAGAGATIAASYVAAAKSDGYTLLIAQANLYSAIKFTYPNLRFDGEKDFTPISSLAQGTLVVVANKNLPIATLKELAPWAKKEKKRIFYATAGAGRVTEYAGAGFQKATGMDMEPVPFKGGSEALVSVAAGDTQISFATAPSVATLIKGGQIKALGVTSAKRFSQLPELPGAEESGIPNYDINYWMGIFGPANMNVSIRNKIFSAVKTALDSDSVKKKILAQGMEAAPSVSPDSFAKQYRDDGLKTLELVRLTAMK